MIYKRYIKNMVKNAKKLQSMTVHTDIIYNVYADSCFVLDDERDNIISVEFTEEDAIEACNGINSGEFSDDGSKANCYYKPELIDKDSGERITRENWKHYAKPEYINYV